jgi:hypothetical protein
MKQLYFYTFVIMLFYISLLSFSNIDTLGIMVDCERFSVFGGDQWVQMLGHLCTMLFQAHTYDRIEEGGHCSALCTLAVINLLCSPLVHAFSIPAPWTQCSILTWFHKMTTQVPESERGQSLTVAKDEWDCFEMPVLHILHSGLFTSPSLNRCPFKW